MTYSADPAFHRAKKFMASRKLDPNPWLEWGRKLAGLQGISSSGRRVGVQAWGE